LAIELEVEEEELDNDALECPNHETKHKQVDATTKDIVVQEPNALVNALILYNIIPMMDGTLSWISQQ
jgi:hypothetical protein